MDVDVPMDPSANSLDRWSGSLSTLHDTDADEKASSVSHKPTYVESFVYQKHAEAETDPAQYVPEPLSCKNQSVSKRSEIETIAGLVCLRPVSPNPGPTECGSSEEATSLQPTQAGAVHSHPKKSDLSIHKNSLPSASVSPHITYCLPSTPSCHSMPSRALAELYNEKPAVHYSLKQDPTTSKFWGMLSPTLTDRPDQSDQYPESEMTASSLSYDNNTTDPSTLLSDLSSVCDYAVEPLFIFERETQDFLNLSSQSSAALDHHVSSESPSAFPMVLYNNTLVNNTLILSGHILQGPETESHNRKFAKGELESGSKPCTQNAPGPLGPPTGPDSAGEYDTRARETEATSHVICQAVQSDNPIDLWMDACQYLSGEEKGARRPDTDGITLERLGSSALSEEEFCADKLAWSWPSPPAERETSGYPSVEEGDVVRRGSGGEIDGLWGPPLVERWSSVDSWETALSDWAAIIASPPEEITAAFTEIGAEIDALTQALARDSEARNAMAPPVETPSHASLGEDPLNICREDMGTSDLHPRLQILMSLQEQSVESQPSPDRTLESESWTDRTLGSEPSPNRTLESEPMTERTLTSELRPDWTPETEPRTDWTLKSEPNYNLCVRSNSITTSPNTPTDPVIIKELQEVRPDSSPAAPIEENKHAGEINSTRICADTNTSWTNVTSTSVEESSTGIRTDARFFRSPCIPAIREDCGLDLGPFQGYVVPKDGDGDTSNEEDVVLLHIDEDVIEGSEEDTSRSELHVEAPGGYKGEHYVPQKDSSVEDRDLRNDASQHANSYLTSGESKVLESESTESEEPQPPLDAAHAPRHTHVPKGAAKNQASLDTPPHRSVLSHEHPESGIPAPPLAAGVPLVWMTISGLEGDQGCTRDEVFNDNKQPSCPQAETCVTLPALEVTGESPLQACLQNRTETTDGTEPLNPGEDIKAVLPFFSEDGTLDRGSGHLRGAAEDCSTNALNISQSIEALNRDLANLVSSPGDSLRHSGKSRVAYLTLDLVDPFFPKATKDTAPQGVQNVARPGGGSGGGFTMPHKTHRSNQDFKARPKRDKCTTGPHPAAPTCKRQENLAANAAVQQPTEVRDHHTDRDSLTGPDVKEDGIVTAGNGSAVNGVPVTRSSFKKKKKHQVTQNVTAATSEPEPALVKEEMGAKQKVMEGKIGAFEAKTATKSGKTKEKAQVSGKLDSAHADGVQKKSQHPETKGLQTKEPQNRGTAMKLQPTTNHLNDDAVKRRRLSEKKFGKMVSALESKLNKTEVAMVPKREEAKATMDSKHRKSYSDMVKQKTPREEPKVVKAIQVEPVSGDPLSLCLWCQFSGALADHTVTWSREGSVLSELKRSGGDESRVSVTISKASHQDLGKYQCVLTSLHASLSLDYLLTYEVLSEMVVQATPTPMSSSPVDIVGSEENVHCSRLLFKEDFLSQQYFGENQTASIVTEAVHFGEGMHRRAFRTKLRAGLVSQLEPGNTCVLKVHNSISYGTKDNDELVQRNFNLAVEECQVQNTAREYIKAYSTVAQSAEAFGEVPEIIPIYLVHRPSNDVPYATLEEELIGDFVKYSVRDGKEINLKRSDSEAGQKCCAFQHWVYDKTDGNLLVTDMQGVGMRLTDVGIATCKKGYKGFRGNCSTSFIDQFKALHMCNKFCEILGLTSLQPKPKKNFPAPKPKPQPSVAISKKKTFGPTVKGKS